MLLIARGRGQHRMSETRDEQPPKNPSLQLHDSTSISISSGTTLPGHPLKRDYKLLSCSSQFELELPVCMKHYSDTPMKYEVNLNYSNRLKASIHIYNIQ